MARGSANAQQLIVINALSALLVAASLASPVRAQPARQLQAARPTPPASAAQPATATGYNAVTTALQKAGVKRCAAKIQNVTEFLTRNGRTGTGVMPLGSDPDNSLITMSQEIISGNVVYYAGATFAPLGDDCSAVYEAVTHWQNSCDEVAAAHYVGFKPIGVLQQTIKVLSNQPNVRVMMVAAGTGCVVIKKELVP